MMNHMEITRRTWTAAVKLAAVLSVFAIGIALAAFRIGDVPEVAIVVPVTIVAFVASWVQTGRIRRNAIDEMIVTPMRRSTRAA